MNDLVNRVKRIAFGFRRIEHYRIRALLYAASELRPTRRHHSALKSEAPAMAIVLEIRGDGFGIGLAMRFSRPHQPTSPCGQ